MITINKLKLKNLCDEVYRTTDSLRKLKPEIIYTKPQRLLILRLILNMSQWQLAKFIGKSQGTVYNIEKGFRKSVDEKVINKVFEEIKCMQRIPSREILIRRYYEISERGTFRDTERARKMSLKASKERSLKGAIIKGPTEQEKRYIEIFQKLGISHKFHALVRTNRNFVVDFALPSENIPKIIIEVKQMNFNYRKRLQAVELAYRAMKIRQKYPYVRLIAILEGNIQKDAIDIVKEEYNDVLVNQSVYKLINIIKPFSKLLA
ncbi:MAG: helix-turn-helix domain-containing protein [Candidatus Aenigmarchaeota archaeon]|nr:helix-turn-helix domain-containing protein [Candidatus Aenigmarchaeota archaeon]